MPIGPEFPAVLEAARAGGDWAWRVLYRDLAPGVLGYVRARGSSSPEDVCSEVFCDVIRGLGRFEGDEAGFRSWVFVIAHHRLLDERRHRRRHPELLREPERMPAIAEPVETEEEALRTAAWEEIEELLSELTPDQREVIVLRLASGLGVEEIAKVLGKRERAVRSLQHRGLQSLRRKLRPNQDEPLRR